MTRAIDPFRVVELPPAADTGAVQVSQPTAALFPRMRAVRAALAAILIGCTGFVVLHDWFGVGGADLDELAGGQLYDAVVLAAGLACFLRGRIVPRERTGWRFLGIAILLWGAGEVYWTAYILDNAEPPYPSPADAFYIGFYPLAIAGLAFLVRARAHEIDWRRWTDAAIAALGTAALGTAFVFDFVADHTTGTGSEVAVSLTYPLVDIAMMSMIVGVIALTGWRPGRTWSLLLAGLTLLVVADVAYTLQAVEGFVPAGNWIDPIYMLAAVALGAVLWLPGTAAIRHVEHGGGWRDLVVPAIFAAVMIGLFAMQSVGNTSSLAAVLWAATMVAVVARLALSASENRRLLEQVRTDSLTGLGNRGGMQVDLARACERAAAGTASTLMLFDLNGFKRYNDSFGHPAGDELLAALGKALRRAVGESGSVYRIGGDEFCSLLTATGADADSVARRAAQALTAERNGIAVSSSWGMVSIPSEAATPAEAMQLADVRMYAQKESRRVVRESDVDAAGVKVISWPQPSRAG